MTANELAYKLEKVSNDMEHSYVVNDWKLLFESALVLRKQAKEIEQLKERLEETRQFYLKQLAITHSDTQSHPIEPVAMRYDFDGYGYRYIDSGSGSDWQTRERGEFLYTKPFFNQKPVAMMVKMDGFDKPEFTTTCSSAALKHPNYTALYDHPMREISDEEIDNIFGICALNTTVNLTTEQCYLIVDAILRKASEK